MVLNTIFAMESFYIIGNIMKPLLKIILITIEEMRYLTKLMSGIPFFLED